MIDKNNTYKEVTLSELLNVVMSRKWLIISITIIFTLGACIYAINLPNKYRSAGLLQVAGMSSGSIQSNSLGGFAALAGIDFGGGEIDKSVIATETLRSRDFVEFLIKNNPQFIPFFVAYRGYDSNSKVDSFDDEIYDTENEIWINSQPAFEEIFLTYLSTVSVKLDIESGLIVIEVVHESQNFAYNLANKVISELNNIERARDHEEAKKSLQYLNNELAKATFFELKTSINQLALSQLEKIMLTEVRDDYMISPIESPYFPEKRHAPVRRNIAIGGTILGLLFSTFLVITFHIFRTRIYSDNKKEL